MSADKTTSGGNGIGFGTVLFIVFLTLKLTGVIAWSWWWVFAPVWVPLVVIVACLALIGALKERN